MTRYSYFIVVAGLLLAMLSSCDDIFPSPSGPVDIGWVPIYEVSDSLHVFREGNRQDAGQSRLFFYDPFDSNQFVVIDSFRYRIDTLKGLSVEMSSSDVQFSAADVYYHIPGIRTLRVEGDSLIVDNLNDEITLSTTDAPILRVSSRRTGAAAPFIYPEQKPDPTSLSVENIERHSYFECLDTSNGVLLGWRFEITQRANCYVYE